MDNENSVQEYLRWHVLRVFFEGFESWQAMRPLLGLSPSLDGETYDDFFRGTNADIFVPLWASVCRAEDAPLLDATTLEVIRFYKQWGYSHVDMDGNPPDYIGQQCRFLEYLCAAALGGETEACAPLREFLDLFTADTVRAMQRALAALPREPEIEWVMALLAGGVQGLPARLPALAWQSFDSAGWRLGKPIPVEEARLVSHASFCDCGGKCKMLARVQEGCVLAIFPDTDFPGKRFVGCARGHQYRHTFLTPRRLRYPMVRRGERGQGKFRRIGWDEAARLLACEVERTAREYGPQSRYVLPGAGVCALARGDRFTKDLLALTGGYLNYYNYYSCSCAEHALPYVYGTDVCGSPEEEMQNTRLLILWGHNPADTVWGDAFLPNLARAKEKGVRIVVIDPRESDTALQYADEWIGIRPSTDGALADAMAYEIWSRGLQDQAFMETFCIGFDREHMPPGVPPEECYHDYLFGLRDGVEKNAAWAQEITGIPADTITRLAVEYASTKPACLMPGLGPQRALCGEQNCRSFAMLACLTGNVGIPGGGSGGYHNRHGHSTPSYAIRENPYAGKIPSFLWNKAAEHWDDFTPADGLLGVQRLEGGIKLMFSLASGMLANQHSNINETVRILRTPGLVECLVVSDLFFTPGARFADILLPGVSFFETENVVPPWNASNYLLFNHKAIEPLFGGRFEYDWIQETAALLGKEAELCKGRTTAEWLEHLYERHRGAEPELPPYAEFRAASCAVFENNPYQIAFSEQRQGKKPFDTPSGKIEIFSRRLYESGLLPGVPSYLACEEGAQDPQRAQWPLLLFGYHTKRRCHSIHDNNPALDAVESPSLWLNPEDAVARGIADGDEVLVFNARGRVRIPARVTRRIVPGAVAMSEGAWYTPDADGVDRRGSINVLTMSHRATPLAKANPQHTNLVQVEKA